MDVVWGYFGEGFGWCVGLEPEVVDYVENLLGLFGRVVGGLDGGSERPDGSLGVGSVAANLTDGCRKRHEQVLTTRWKQQFGPSYFPRAMSTTSYPFVSHELSEGTFHIDAHDGTAIKLRYETFRTPYRQFALLWLPKQQSFLARHRKRPVILLA